MIKHGACVLFDIYDIYIHAFKLMFNYKKVLYTLNAEQYVCFDIDV